MCLDEVKYDKSFVDAQKVNFTQEGNRPSSGAVGCNVRLEDDATHAEKLDTCEQAVKWTREIVKKMMLMITVHHYLCPAIKTSSVERPDDLAASKQLPIF